MSRAGVIQILLAERETGQFALPDGLSMTDAVDSHFRAARDGTIDLQAERTARRNIGFWISDKL